MWNPFKKNDDEKKDMSFDKMVGMANSFIGMMTMGKKNLDSVIAEYTPQIVAGAVQFQEQNGGNPMVLMIQLSEDQSYLIASIYKLNLDGTLDLFTSFPLDNILALIEQFKNAEKNQDNATTAIATKSIAAPIEGNTTNEPGTTNTSSEPAAISTTNAEGTGSGSGTNPDDNGVGVHEPANGTGTPA